MQKYIATSVSTLLAAVVLSSNVYADVTTGMHYRWECADNGVTGSYLSYEDDAREAAQVYADDETTFCANIYIVEADNKTWEEVSRYKFYPEE